MKTLKIGIAGYDQMKARTMAIARGEHTPTKGEPKVWFTSIESFAKLLSEHNRQLLELIARERPRSLTELAQKAGRSKSNLSRTLKTMSRYGLVELTTGGARQAGSQSTVRPSEAGRLVDGGEDRISERRPVTGTGGQERDGTPTALRYNASGVSRESAEGDAMSTLGTRTVGPA